MAIKVNSRDYIEEQYKDSKDSVESTKANNYNFYLIYDPIVETDNEVLGGPWCFSIEGKRAYLAFSSIHLAEQFVDLWRASSEHQVIRVNQIGSEFYQELLNDVEQLLLLTSINDIESLLKDVDRFPYNHYLIPRQRYLLH